jgi:hypothetical protein
MSYRQFLERSLDRRALAEKNRNAPDEHRFCNGFCFDYLPRDRFSGIHVICNDCRNRVHMAERMIERNLTTLETVRKNPLIIHQDTDGLQTHKRCETCHQTKVVTDFEHGRCVCKSCRYLKAAAQTKEKVQGYIHDIEKLRNDPPRLEAFLNSIAKDCLILIVAHYQVGRKATDNKSTIVLNILQHFRRLGDPSRCSLCGGGIASRDETVCSRCQTKRPIRRNEKRQGFIDALDTTFEELEPMDPERDMDRFNKDEMTMIARKAGLKFEQIMRKHDLFDLLNVFLINRKEERERHRAVEELKGKSIEMASFPELVVDEFRIQARTSDGYINATQLCKAGGKRFSHWYHTEQTKTYITALESETDLPASQLVDVKKGNSTEFEQGSWIHPDLAVNLAQWISPLFGIRVSRWVREILTTGHASFDPRSNEELIRLQREQEERKRVETNHKRLLLKREYHRFGKGPCFYIIRAGEGVFKIGFDGVDVNERFRAYRTSIPHMRVCHMVFTPKSAWLEESMLMRYHDFRVQNNHEFIGEISLLELTGAVDTLLRYCHTPHQAVSAEEIALYNDG